MQVTSPNLDQLSRAIAIAKVERTQIVIDWVNRTIRVLSDEKTHPTKALSTGPMKYRDILIEVSHE